MEFLDRLKIEKNELSDKIIRLQKFIESEKFENIGDNQQSLLIIQLSVMLSYESILNIRIIEIEKNL